MLSRSTLVKVALVMRNGHARARFCPPARYFGDARLARAKKICPLRITNT